MRVFLQHERGSTQLSGLHQEQLLRASSVLQAAYSISPSGDLHLLGRDEEGWHLLLTWMQEKPQQLHADAVHKVLLIAHLYNIQPTLNDCLCWLHKMIPSTDDQHPHFLAKWLHTAEVLDLDDVKQRLMTWWKAWDLSNIRTSPLYVLKWMLLAESESWEWMLDHCLDKLSPLPDYAPLPAASLHMEQQRRMLALNAVLNDLDCAQLSKATLLRLARLPLASLGSLVASEQPVLVAACQEPSCNARLAIFRGKGEESRTNEVVMRIPSMGPAIAQAELYALGEAKCKCGGQFGLAHENKERGRFVKLV